MVVLPPFLAFALKFCMGLFFITEVLIGDLGDFMPESALKVGDLSSSYSELAVKRPGFLFWLSPGFGDDFVGIEIRGSYRF